MIDLSYHINPSAEGQKYNNNKESNVKYKNTSNIITTINCSPEIEFIIKNEQHICLDNDNIITINEEDFEKEKYIKEEKNKNIISLLPKDNISIVIYRVSGSNLKNSSGSLRSHSHRSVT